MNRPKTKLNLHDQSRRSIRFLSGLFLLPLHPAINHYKKRYHLRYRHARKLFFLDISLILGLIILIISSLYWFWYQPHSDVALLISIEGTEQRVRSGDDFTLTVNYRNITKETLQNIRLYIETPPTFLHNDHSNKFDISLGDISDFATGSIKITGIFIGTQNSNEHFYIDSSYDRDGAKVNSRHTVIITSRGSVLHTTLEIPSKIVIGVETPITITLQNIGNNDLAETQIDTSLGDGIDFTTNNFASDRGVISIYDIPRSSSKTIEGILTIDKPIIPEEIDISLNTTIVFRDTKIKQIPIERKIKIINPNISLYASTDKTFSNPGETITYDITIENTGHTPLTNLSLKIPASTHLIDTKKIIGMPISLDKTDLVIDYSHFGRVNILLPGARITREIRLPIHPNLNPNIEKLELSLNLKATYDLDGEESSIHKSIEMPSIMIKKIPELQIRSLYYSAQGDQLGRGPLPPKINEETKYWLAIEANTKDYNLNSFRVDISLPKQIKYTGESSVSRGDKLTENKDTNTLTYTAKDIPNRAYTGIFFEVSATPNEDDLDKHFDLVREIVIREIRDDFTLTSKIFGPINSALIGDLYAQSRGTFVIR